MDYTYLLINICTIFFPFIFSFHPKLDFYKTWKSFFPAVVLTGIIFIIWDSWFTHMGIWGFNSRYITGIKLFGLPVEEILFFFCIPYACVFTYHCFSLYFKKPFTESLRNTVTGVLLLILVSVGFAFISHIYTAITYFSLAMLLAVCSFILKVNWLVKFYIAYAVLLIPFLIVNGLLTGTGLAEPVVWYSKSGITGLRILTIPVEDVFYGMELILLNVLIYENLKKVFQSKSVIKTSILTNEY